MKPKMFKITAMLLILAGHFFSCNSKNEVDQPLSDEQISFNLSKNGLIDPTLLIGEWEISRFSYTADGNKILNVAAISSNSTVTAVDTYPSSNFTNEEELLGPLLFMHCGFFYAKTGNLIDFLQERFVCYAINVQYTIDEINVFDALKSAYSFVIKGNELIIYFTEAENKNLLILKKR